jgi:hypothetical protein
LVVSEETGVISAAREGKLVRALDTAALTELLDGFVARLSARPKPLARVLAALISRPLTKIIALSVAAALWLAIAFKVDVVQRTFDAPIEYRNVPAELVVERTSPESVRVTLSGPARDLDKVEASPVVISLDASDVEVGWERLRLSEQDVRRPDGLEVVSIKPTRVKSRVKVQQDEP